MDTDVAFVARLRSGGGSGSSLQLTIPKDVVSLLDLREGRYVKVALQVLEREKGRETSKGPEKGSS